MTELEIIRKAIVEARFMDLDTYLETFKKENTILVKAMWELQQINFGKWFMRLEDADQSLYVNFIKGQDNGHQRQDK